MRPYRLRSTTASARASSSCRRDSSVRLARRPPSVVEGHLPGALQGAGRRDADEHAFERATGDRGAHDLVLLRREEQRQRRRAVAQVGARDLARLDRVARAVEDVVDDLERDAEQPAVVAAAAAEQAGGLEQLSGLEGAPLEVALDGRVGVVPLPPLQRLAPRERERCFGERRHALDVAARRELGERAREEVVAGRAGGVGAVGRPRRRLAAPHPGAVDQVVVDERRHVDELHRRSRRDRGRGAGRRREKREHRSQPLAAGCERLGADLGDEAGVACHRPVEELLDLGRGSRRGRGRRGPSRGWRSSRRRRVQGDDRAAEEPEARRPRTRSRRSGRELLRPGKRRTLAGRYV